MWQVSQVIGDPVLVMAMCTACAPAMFGYTAPVGPFGVPSWQEVQPAGGSGDDATWHVWQTGPAFVEGAETS